MKSLKSLKKFKDMFEYVSPLLIKPKSTSITVSLSKRFFLFQLMKKTIQTIEDDPYLNFISLLRNYKIIDKFLYGTVERFYKDRNKLYFKKFFLENRVYQLVKQDMEWLVSEVPEAKVTMTKRGVIIYDNYHKNKFNLLLLTVHAGTWLPANLKKKMVLTDIDRYKEEDIASHQLYGRLFIEKGGIWIDNKQSRFAIDFNRPFSKAIYEDGQEKWLDVVWKKPLTKGELFWLRKSYDEFYFTLARLLESYRFNIIFDGHTMSDSPDRPAISFGTNFIPNFYMPIVISMRNKLRKLGYSPVMFNKPYKGGHILEWMHQKFPDVFTFSVEINKRLYMTRSRKKVVKKNRNKLAQDLAHIFDIELEDETVREAILSGKVSS